MARWSCTGEGLIVRSGGAGIAAPHTSGETVLAWVRTLAREHRAPGRARRALTAPKQRRKPKAPPRGGQLDGSGRGRRPYAQTPLCGVARSGQRAPDRQ